MDIQLLLNLLGSLFGKQFRLWRARRSYLKHINTRLLGKGLSGDDTLELKVSVYSVPKLQTLNREPSFEASASDEIEFNILRLIQDNDFLVLVGEPGSGKSTLMKFLSYNFSDPAKIKRSPVKQLPVLVRVRDWANSQKKLVEYLSEGQDDILPDEVLAADLLQTYIKKGKAMLLLDGLDEAGSEYDRLLEEIQGLVRDLPVGNKVVVTTRHTGYHASLARFKHYELKGLDQLQITAIAERALQDAGKARTFVELVQNSDGLADYLENPFLLNLILSLYNSRDKSLPATKVGILDSVIERLIKFPGSDPIVKMRLFEKAKGLLRKIASRFLNDIDFVGVNLRELDEEVDLLENDETDQEVMVLLRDLVLKKGVLWESRPGFFEFVHRSFMEYLCGSFVAYQIDPCAVLEGKYLEDEFQEVIRFTMASLKHDPGCKDGAKASRIVSEILGLRPRNYEILHQPEMMAGLCIGEYGDGIPPESVECVQAAILAMVPKFRSQYEVRLILMLWAGTKMAKKILDPLIARFRLEPNPVIRFDLVETIGACGNKDSMAMEWLSHVHHGDEIAFVRDKALEQIHSWSEYRFLDAEDLLQQVSKDEEFVSSLTLEDALALVAGVNPEIVDKLKEIGVSHPTSEVRERVFDIFQHERFHSQEMVLFLLDRMSREDDEFVRCSIAGALSEMKSQIHGLGTFLKLVSVWMKETDTGPFLALTPMLENYGVLPYWPYRNVYRKRVISQFEEVANWIVYFRNIRQVDHQITSKIIAYHLDFGRSTRQLFLDYLRRTARKDSRVIDCLSEMAEKEPHPNTSYQAMDIYVVSIPENTTATARISTLATLAVHADVRVNALLHLFLQGKLPAVNLGVMFQLFTYCTLDTQVRIVEACKECNDWAAASSYLFDLLGQNLSGRLFRSLLNTLVEICPKGRLLELEALVLDMFLSVEEEELDVKPDWKSSHPADLATVYGYQLDHRPTVLLEALRTLSSAIEEKN